MQAVWKCLFAYSFSSCFLSKTHYRISPYIPQVSWIRRGRHPGGPVLGSADLHLRPSGERDPPRGRARRLETHAGPGAQVRPGALRVPGQHQGKDEPRIQAQRRAWVKNNKGKKYFQYNIPHRYLFSNLATLALANLANSRLTLASYHP